MLVYTHTHTLTEATGEKPWMHLPQHLSQARDPDHPIHLSYQRQHRKWEEVKAETFGQECAQENESP